MHAKQPTQLPTETLVLFKDIYMGSNFEEYSRTTNESSMGTANVW